jgi:hypothetical protein
MRDYLQMIPNLIYESSTQLGWNVSSDERLFEELIEKMIGKYMGVSPKKGITYRWIPNHLQDTGGRIAPRSFLKLFDLAAAKRLERFEQLTELYLLQPPDLQSALMDTSEDRIKELAQEEYPWLESLKTNLEGLKTPMPKETFLEAVRSTKWSPEKENKPPVQEPEGIVQYLIQLGVVESQIDDRINIPEIYSYGFKVKRRGGIQRPQ